MKVILLENVLHKGQRYKAGASIDVDAETASKFERSGVAFIDTVPKAAPALPTPKPIEIAPELPPVEQKATHTSKKASASKKSARGQK